MGYNPGTGNSLDVLAIKLKRMAEVAENSGRVTGTESNQTTIKLKAMIEVLQAIVAAQQTMLEALQKVTDRLSSPRAGSANTGASPVSIGGSWGNYAPITFTVPAECTRVAVIGIGSAYLAATGGGANAAWLRMAINSDVGERIGAAAIDMVASTSIAHAAVINVTPGSTVTVRAQAMSDVSGSSALIATAALINFL